MSRRFTATAAASALLVLSMAATAADAITLPTWLHFGASASAPAATSDKAATIAAATPATLAANPLPPAQLPN
ncbi:MAG TPA: hypothetical protein PLX45_14585, partial [Piscinibacter sp.]|nr:hypothetical protein [Piscinibacter sp.]